MPPLTSGPAFGRPTENAPSAEADSLLLRPRLLIVDDDAILRRVVAKMAADSTLFSSVETADDGYTALELVSQHIFSGDLQKLPNLILTDGRMPMMDGVGLTTSLKSQPATAAIPIAMFSSSCDTADRDRALSAGCVAYFSKPKGRDELGVLIRAVAALIPAAA